MLLYQKQEVLSAKIFIWWFILSEAHSYLRSLKGSYSFFRSDDDYHSSYLNTYTHHVLRVGAAFFPEDATLGERWEIRGAFNRSLKQNNSAADIFYILILEISILISGNWVAWSFVASYLAVLRTEAFKPSPSFILCIFTFLEGVSTPMNVMCFWERCLSLSRISRSSSNTWKTSRVLKRELNEVSLFPPHEEFLQNRNVKLHHIKWVILASC